MPNGIVDKPRRNYRYSRLIQLKATRAEAKQGMDYSSTRFNELVARLSMGMTFAKAKLL